MSKPETPEPPSREITPEPLYLRRREFLRNAGLGVLTAAATGVGLVRLTSGGPGARAGGTEGNPGAGAAAAQDSRPLQHRREAHPLRGHHPLQQLLRVRARQDRPGARTRARCSTRPWTVAVEGEVKKPQTVDIDQLLKWFPLEERVYRMRCVEAWSMVIPWLGFPLGDLIKRLEPTRQGEVRGLHDAARSRSRCRAQRARVLDWPYVEGLRMDEAMHPLTLLAVGLYGKTLPNQNGAPLRLVVPWKYGFKGIKSIVKISFTEKQPPTTWNLAGARASTASTPT